MTIKQRIEELAAPNRFYYGRNHDINIQADDNEFPAVVMIEPDTLGFYLTDKQTIRKAATVFIRFLNLLPDGIGIAEQAEDRRSTIEAMEGLAAEFLNKVINDDVLELVFTGTETRVPSIAVIDAYDAHLCGVEIQLQLRLIYPETICP